MKSINILFICNFCIILICILLRLFVLPPQYLLGVEWRTDLTYFYDFVYHYPILYSKETWSVYCVLYLPYFYWLFYPFTLFNETISFIIISIITLYALFRLYNDSKEIDNEYMIICQICVLFASMNVGLNGTLEVIVLMIYTYLLKQLYHQKFNWKSAILFSIFLFKIIPIIYLLLFYKKMKRNEFLQFILIIIMVQIGLNLYFISINPSLLDISYLIEIFVNKHGAMGLISSIWLTRCSFNVPLIYFIWMYIIKSIRIWIIEQNIIDINNFCNILYH